MTRLLRLRADDGGAGGDLREALGTLADPGSAGVADLEALPLVAAWHLLDPAAPADPGRLHDLACADGAAPLGPDVWGLPPDAVTLVADAGLPACLAAAGPRFLDLVAPGLDEGLAEAFVEQVLTSLELAGLPLPAALCVAGPERPCSETDWGEGLLLHEAGRQVEASTPSDRACCLVEAATEDAGHGGGGDGA